LGVANSASLGSSGGYRDALARPPVDLSGLTNLSRIANTPDPRDFYRVSRVVLMPSLWRESLGRVAIEWLFLNRSTRR
jgi:hypothetical protein